MSHILSGRRTTAKPRFFRVTAVTAAAVLGLAACSSDADDAASVQEATPAATTTETSESPSPMPTSSEPSMSSSSSEVVESSATSVTYSGTRDLTFRGGMVGSAMSITGDTASVDAWLPGMANVETCDFKLWLPQEGDKEVEESASVWATSDSDPNEVAALFTATVPVSGLEGAKRSVYLQRINIQSCTLEGERQTVVESVPADRLEMLDPVFLASSADTLAIAPYGLTEPTENLSPEPYLFGFHPADGRKWEKAFAGQRPTVARYNAYAFKVTDQEDDTLYSAEDFKEVYSAESLTTPQVALTPTDYLVTTETDSRSQQSLLRNGTETEVTGGFFSSRAALWTATDGQGNPILVGKYCADGATCQSDNQAIGYIGLEPVLKQTIDATTVTNAGVEFKGASFGRVYLVNSNGEQVIRNVDGSEVSTTVDEQISTYYPQYERIINGTSWTWWQSEEESNIIFTRDGARP